MLPKDPIILLSMINTKLRDHHDSLDDFCLSYNVESTDIIAKLAAIDYHYDKTQNQFK